MRAKVRYNTKKDRYDVNVKPEEKDIMNLDMTLAFVIAPMLREYRENKCSSPDIDNEDVPEHLKTRDESNVSVDPKVHDKWDWAVGEMIFAFEKVTESENGLFEDQETRDRVNHGLYMFGVYYQNLWN